MLRDTPARCGRGIGRPRRRSILELLACIPGGTRIAVAVGLLACFGLEGLWASTRAVPHRLTVHPNGATVAANQTQQFEVTDAEGRSVAVHWNLSGLGCSGVACGTIDEQGVYRTPSSLPQPRVVTLEGVLVSDPNYSVLTQVRLEDAAAVTVSPASAHVATGQTQQFTALMVGRQNVASRAELPPLPHAVAAAPVVARQTVASIAGLLPLPHPVAAAPVVARQTVASIAGLLPLPHPVAAAPVVARQNLASSAELPPLPHALAAALVVGRQNVASRAELPPLQNGVAAAPVVGRQNVARSVELPPLPYAVAALSPTSAQIPTRKTQQFTAPVVGRQNIASSAGLLPVPDDVAAAPAGTVVSAQHPPVVTYRDGQLTINAQNSTLAEVLKLVAEKTGAVIEVPPGSGLDRIVEHTGPGQADDVLARLLNGSPFDFIIVGSPQRPHELTQVLLSLRQADTPASLPPQLAKTVASPFLYTPPEPAPFAPAVATDLDNFQPPKEPLSPEVIGQMMKDRAQQLREKLRPQ
jgi:hypothetical protein